MKNNCEIEYLLFEKTENEDVYHQMEKLKKF